MNKVALASIVGARTAGEVHRGVADEGSKQRKPGFKTALEDVKALATVLAMEDYIEHAVAPFEQSAPGRVNGTQAMRQTAEWLLAQFPAMHMTAEAMVSEGNTVAVRVLSEGTNLGPLNGVVPPTGRRFSARQSHWYRVADGKLAEHRATREDLPAMLQLGVIQPPGGPPS